MRSRALCRGKIPPRCVPRRQSVAIFSLHASRKWPRTRKRGFLARFARRASKTSWLWQDVRAMYPKAPQIAVGGYTARRSCREGPLFAARAPRIMHGAQILPSVAAPNSASDRSHGATLMGGGTGRGRLLVGRGDAAKGVRGVVGCRALAAKLASVKLRLQVSDADNLAES